MRKVQKNIKILKMLGEKRNEKLDARFFYILTKKARFKKIFKKIPKFLLKFYQKFSKIFFEIFSKNKKW